MTVATPVTIPIKNLELAPGSFITISEVSWEQFEAILVELGEKRSVRIAYCEGILEIMSPLPIHERLHRIISDIVKVLLDAQERDWEDFGSTTFRQQKKSAGLEPDTCFYIRNAERVRDCMRMDLEVYPPADLAIESDVTSKTTFAAYARIGIPEIWVYENGTLKIYLLQGEQYVESAVSPTFPDLPIVELMPKLVARAFEKGSSRMLRQLRQQIAQAGLSKLDF